MKLKPVPNKTWQQKYDKLMTDPYLSKKYLRERRLKDKQKYINELCPEVKRLKDKLIIDIGPGPGEFLELCREYGHKVLGIDAKLKDSEMGDEYIQMSKLMTTRQKIDVMYCGLVDFIETKSAEIKDDSVLLINSQGSIEQSFAQYMEGPRHRETKNASLLSWVITEELTALFDKMFVEFARMLNISGSVLIWANGAKNSPQYDNMILNSAAKCGLKLVYKKGKTLHKFRKYSKAALEIREGK